MKKLIAASIFVLLCTAILLSTMGKSGDYQIADSNIENFALLLSDLEEAAASPSPDDRRAIDADLMAIRAVSPRDYSVAKTISDHWEQVYLDPGYRLNLHNGEASADALKDTGIVNSRTHAFVILGYELKDGEMTDELKGRCEAAAAAAKVFPETILVRSGGATGVNNPDKHTEAGMMKTYLVEVCGLDGGRIYTDERAMTTAENALNTMAILREHHASTMTIVTSSYHQRWGQVLYNGVAALYAQNYGYAPVIVSNYNFPIEPENEKFRNDYRIAASQLSGILGLPRKPQPGQKQG